MTMEFEEFTQRVDARAKDASVVLVRRKASKRPTLLIGLRKSFMTTDPRPFIKGGDRVDVLVSKDRRKLRLRLSAGDGVGQVRGMRLGGAAVDCGYISALGDDELPKVYVSARVVDGPAIELALPDPAEWAGGAVDDEDEIDDEEDSGDLEPAEELPRTPPPAPKLPSVSMTAQQFADRRGAGLPKKPPAAAKSAPTPIADKANNAPKFRIEENLREASKKTDKVLIDLGVGVVAFRGKTTSLSERSARAAAALAAVMPAMLPTQAVVRKAYGDSPAAHVLLSGSIATANACLGMIGLEIHSPLKDHLMLRPLGGK